MFSLLRTTTPSISRRAFSTTRSLEAASALVFLETKGTSLVPATLNAITAAKKLGGQVHGLLLGKDEASCQGPADEAKK